MKCKILIRRNGATHQIQTVELDILPPTDASIRVNDPQNGFTDARVVRIDWDVVVTPPEVEIIVE